MQEVVLEIRSGLVEAVSIPDGIKVTIRDYDTDGMIDGVEKDENGEEFIQIELD